MITIRKLQSLPPATRHRKIARLLESWERSGDLPADRYLRDLATSIENDPGLPADVQGRARALRLGDPGGPGDPGDRLRDANALRHALMRHLGAEPADWDLLAPRFVTAHEAPSAPRLTGVSLYLESIRSPFNLGSIIRTAAAFGVATVCVSDDCPPLDHPRVLRSAMGAAVTLVRGPLEAALEHAPGQAPGDALGGALGGAGPVIALELGGEPVAAYPFPARGVLVLGSEELGVSPDLLERADARVSIPLGGAKASLNVGVACGIALAAWQAASGSAW